MGTGGSRSASILSGERKQVKTKFQLFFLLLSKQEVLRGGTVVLIYSGFTPLLLTGVIARLSEWLRPPFCPNAPGGQQATNTGDVASKQPSCA